MAKGQKSRDDLVDETLEKTRRARAAAGRGSQNELAYMFNDEDYQVEEDTTPADNFGDQLQKATDNHDVQPINADEIDREGGVAGLFFHYKAHPTIARFHESKAQVKCLWGPYGSGKTTGCIAEIVRIAREEMPPMRDGTRKSRWAVVRATKPNLERATLRSFETFLPARIFGEVIVSKMQAKYMFDDQDGRVEIEVDFIGLDNADDVHKLRSTEYTGAYINEASEVRESAFAHLRTRIGRYPSKSQMRNPNRRLPKVILIDTNPTDTDHWIFRGFWNEDKPPNWALFRQPGGLADDAENLEFLDGGRDYYTKDMAGNNEDFLKVFRDGEPGFVSLGTAVFPQFRQSLHANIPLMTSKMLPLIVGMDFGREPAAIFMQKDGMGRWNVLGEITTEDCSIVEFADMLMPYIRRNFEKVPSIEFYGDPAGMADSQTRDENCFDVLAGAGISAEPASTNSTAVRFEVVRRLLKRLGDKGEPFISFDVNKCPVLIKALAGGYCFKERELKPEKNPYSHPAEALQYGLMGGGEDVELTLDRTTTRPRPQPTKSDWDYWIPQPKRRADLGSGLAARRGWGGTRYDD